MDQPINSSSKKWDNIEEVYQAPDFPVKKGTVVEVRVETETSIEKFDQGTYSTDVIFHNWMYIYNDRRIKPFKLVSYECLGTGFQAKLLFVKKSKTVDELKLACQDILDVYNYFGIQMISWVNKKV
ncbi:hypothetical protein [Tumebacillus lipolyticus]|uniref:Uncharacterized protein n=1 Tax=Tumebacillus lipolyticus TaxID=1280370 RepID=A0ABW4ZYA0_9BACL